MNAYRIFAQQVLNSVVLPSQNLELVACLTPTGDIAQGKWYGVVFDDKEAHPFVLNSVNGHVQYAGGDSQTRYFSIVTRPVVVGEIFELTWRDASDKYYYSVISVQQLNAA